MVAMKTEGQEQLAQQMLKVLSVWDSPLTVRVQGPQRGETLLLGAKVTHIENAIVEFEASCFGLIITWTVDTSVFRHVYMQGAILHLRHTTMNRL